MDDPACGAASGEKGSEGRVATARAGCLTDGPPEREKEGPDAVACGPGGKRVRSPAMRSLLLFFTLHLLVVVVLGGSDPETGPEVKNSAVRFDPVVRDIEGWTVHVEPALLEGESGELGARALQMLANHLQRIKILIPEGPLRKLQQMEFWIEHDHPRIRGMQYHPSRHWLMANRHDPRLTRTIHIPQAAELLSRQQMLKHPAVILHELAHAYHDQVLGFDHPEILAAYERAKAAGRYEQVLLYTGEKVRHYGLTDAKEYFAEGTEAYFYRNDFYPFVRAELKEHDPDFHDLLGRIWENSE
jgi:hypothetical protein